MPPKKEKSDDRPKGAAASTAASSSADEMSEDISSQIDTLIEEGKDFLAIFEFYLSKKNLTVEQTSKWMEKLNKYRSERKLSKFARESKEQKSALKMTEAAIENFVDRLCKKFDWSKKELKEETASLEREETKSLEKEETKSLEKEETVSLEREETISLEKEETVSPKRKDETSSDSSSEDEQARPRRHRKVTRQHSWKEFKNTDALDNILVRKTKTRNVNTLVKMTVKELFKRKKKAKKLAKEKEMKIEVDKDEVIDVMYEVTDHMAKKYLPKIKLISKKLDPGFDRPSSDCESGSYDSEDDFYAHREDKRSILPKLAMSVNPELLVREGLLETLLVTLPLCMNYTDNEELEDFIDILRDTKEEQSRPESQMHQYTSSSTTTSESLKAKEVKVTAAVEPSPSNETLAGMVEIKDWRRESIRESIAEMETSSQMSTEEISESLRRRSLKSAGSEESQSFPFIDESTSSDPVFPERIQEESRATLASPEDISDIQIQSSSDSSSTAVSSEQSTSSSSSLQRRSSRRKSNDQTQLGTPPAKKNK